VWQLLTLGDPDDVCVAEGQDDTDKLTVSLEDDDEQLDRLLLAETLDVDDTVPHPDNDGVPDIETLLVTVTVTHAELDTDTEGLDDRVDDTDDDIDGVKDDVAELLAVWLVVTLTVPVALPE